MLRVGRKRTAVGSGGLASKPVIYPFARGMPNRVCFPFLEARRSVSDFGPVREPVIYSFAGSTQP